MGGGKKCLFVIITLAHVRPSGVILKPGRSPNCFDPKLREA
jgi:hypothetical protein